MWRVLWNIFLVIGMLFLLVCVFCSVIVAAVVTMLAVITQQWWIAVGAISYATGMMLAYWYLAEHS